MTDADDQNDELLALANIYDESVITTQKDSNEQNVGTLRVDVELTHPFHLAVASLDVQHEIEHLPPVILSFSLPADYPSLSPPQYSVACSWLTDDQIKQVRCELDEIWSSNRGSVILFMWMNFLQNDLIESLHVSSPISLTPETLTAVLDHDHAARKRVFDMTMYTCEVCFCDKIGASCMRFEGCGHVYCRACTKSYLEMQINEGTVVDICCPAPKCQTRVSPGQVKELVGELLFERYDRLLLQRSLDTMADIHYCPRLACHYPVLIEEKEGMGSCPSCHFVFCIYCKMVYHGVSPCHIVSENMQLIREEYLCANEAVKREMEKRYGRKNIRRIVEESFSQQWVEENCKKCPNCAAQIQKTDGCNKMSCTKCRSYFCWLCLTVINQANPYSHFNVTTSPCFNKLFQGVVLNDEDDDDIEWLVDVDAL